jgi:outer membrane biosynthesis protein TonB
VSAVAPRDGMSLRAPIVVSAALHLVVIALFVLARGAPSVSLPPTYKVSLVAAPPGPRQVGVVQPTPPAAAPTPPATPAPVSRAVPDPSRMKAPPVKAPARPVKAPKVATPSATPAAAPAKATPAPVAGGGPQGGRGADVANVQIAGTDFPYPEYLQNVVRQIAIRFKPPGGRELQAVVAFLIRRDGSVTGIRLTTRSGVYGFDTEAMGAVDAAAGARAFGALPQGFADDVLPVIFSFDPRLIR